MTLVERSLATTDFGRDQSDLVIAIYRIPRFGVSFHTSVWKMSSKKFGIKKSIEIAVRKLGYSEVRPIQVTVIQRFMEGHDIFVSLPTVYAQLLSKY